jgi:hypothetical protein
MILPDICLTPPTSYTDLEGVAIGGWMTAQTGIKISTTVDRALLSSVDAYLEDHPDRDRDTVIDEALRIWLDLAREQDQAMEEQFDGPDAPEEEMRAWRAIRDASARMMFSRDPNGLG